MFGEPERLPVRVQRPAVAHAYVRAADNTHEPAAQMALDAFVAVAHQLPERREERRPVR